MTVKELIKKLKNYPLDMEVKYSSYSEGILMDIQNVGVEKNMYDFDNLNAKVVVIQEE